MSQQPDRSEPTGPDAPVDIPDEALPEDLRPGEDNPLAEGLEPGERAGDLLEEGKHAEQSQDEHGDSQAGDDASDSSQP